MHKITHHSKEISGYTPNFNKLGRGPFKTWTSINYYELIINHLRSMKKVVGYFNTNPKIKNF